MEPVEPDSQQVEIFGRAALTAQLVADGLEVAAPERDIGIDLLTYSLDPWGVIPIQMKAARRRSLSVHRKYERFRELLMVYVWNVGSPGEVEFYAVPWPEAKALAKKFGWTETESWRRTDAKAGYGTTSPSARHREALEVHRMRRGDWRRLIERMIREHH